MGPRAFNLNIEIEMPQPVMTRVGAWAGERLLASTSSTAATSAAAAASAARAARRWSRAATANCFAGIAPDQRVDWQTKLFECADGVLDVGQLSHLVLEERWCVVDETAGQVFAQLLVLGSTEDQQVPSVVDVD